MRCCLTPGCPNLVVSGRCADHGGPRKAWHQATPVQRLNGHQNAKRRKALFAREPLCRPCVAAGRVTIATIRDHIVPLTEHGTEDVENEQPICADCHKTKTQAESARGVMRAW